MRSIKEIFVIGHGPSSSHTMGPAKGCEIILEKYKDIKFIKVVLYGSLALTGKGHLTDYIIDLKLKDIPHTIEFNVKKKVKHPNTFIFYITDSKGNIKKEPMLSVGGGTVLTKENYKSLDKDTYPHNSMKEILAYCKENNLSLANYVRKFEDSDIDEYIKSCLKAMVAAAKRGISAEGYLPGELHIKRKAKAMYEELTSKPESLRKLDMLIATSSIAVSEENAAGGVVVIAPTCGSAGVIPGVLAYCEAKKIPHDKVIDSMLVAGLIGILCKTNASVAGAEAGCQAEIGVACSMGAALVACTKNLPNEKIAQAAEIALEHSLGLTCDPVLGYVQIPCIERCAMFALKAKDAAVMAALIDISNAKISFDDSVKTMYQTGLDLNPGYKETSQKGLAKLFKKKL